MTLWTPAQLSSSDMSLWLDGSDAATLFDAVSGGSAVAENGAIARWQDKSGNSNHATQSTSGFRPLRVSGGVRFDGTDDRMTLATGFTGTDYAFFGVLKKRLSGNAMFVLANGSGAGGGYVYADFSDGNIYFTNGTTFRQTTGSGNNLNTVIVSQDDHLHRDGISIALTSGVNSGTTINTVGARPGSSAFANADFYELILGPQSLIRWAFYFEGYFAHKYNLTANLPSSHPYKTNAPTVGSGGTAGFTGLSGVGRLGT
jgi:hypothetical protein